MSKKAQIFLIAVILLLNLCACKKDSFTTDANAGLGTSTDKISFDTVFTSVGSVTQSFKINNLNDKKLLLSEVKLMGADTSAFRLNINGYPSSDVKNIEIAANDSIYVFVTVSVNPGTANLPFIINDSIRISYNGNNRYVQLEAYGQNAHFLRDSIITKNTTFKTDKPYVILGSLTVKENVTLNILAGTRIYAHADAPIIVNGTITSKGNATNPVYFRGDRTDNDYKDLPAGWPGIYCQSTSKNNYFIFTHILNAYQALVAYDASSNASPKIQLSKCIIDNAYDAGIVSAGSSINAENCLISNCGENIRIAYGGTYTLTNCTVVTYGNYYIQHKYPVLSLSDYTDIDGTIYTNPLTANFINCIFWGDNGSVDNEVSLGIKGNGSSAIFQSCIYKAKADPADANFISSIKNIDPAFDSINVFKRIFDFHITKSGTSPAIDNGIPTSYQYDLDNTARSFNNTNPDIGCYEKH